jgi:hypothetical protein
MSNQSTVLPRRRVCVLLGGPREPVVSAAPRTAALLRAWLSHAA